MHFFTLLITLLMLHAICMLESCAAGQNLTIYPAPAGEGLSEDYTVSVNGNSVPVYSTKVLNGGPASFAGFEFNGSVTVTITPKRGCKSVTIRPASYHMKSDVRVGCITFTLDRPRYLTIEPDGNIDRALHLFADAPEKNAPKKDDPNVIYFGPGVHDFTTGQIKSGQTLYIAGGAIVRPTIQRDIKPTVEKNWAGNKEYGNLFTAEGAKNIAIRGRGILDLSALPWHARTTFVISNCDNVLVEGITILDSAAWVVAIFGSRNVTVRNIKQICGRENSDGIDICNTRDVLVEDCFLRNNDDEICVKTTSPSPAQTTERVMVRNCVIWNDRARGLGITSETRTDIHDVTFRNCDIIHDLSKGGDCAALAILVSDSGTMSDIRFEDIRIEDARTTLFKGWIGKDMWGHDAERGHVNGVFLRNITYTGANHPPILFTGYDATHLFDNINLQNVRYSGEPATTPAEAYVTANEFTHNLTVKK